MLLPSGIDDFKDIIEGGYYYVDINTSSPMKYYSYLFRGLKIENDPYALKHMNNYPVVHITFKDAKFQDWNAEFAMLKKIIGKIYAQKRYLLESEKLGRWDKKFVYIGKKPSI